MNNSNSSESSRDVFPATQKTWIQEKYDAGERLEVNRFVMEVYFEPLSVYFHGTGYRWLGEAADLVQAFFADRLQRERFFDKWYESQRPLRRWLMTAFRFFLKEESKRHKRDKRNEELVEEPVARPETEADMDRAFACAVVREAQRIAQAECEANGLEAHWKLFIAHVLEGVPYKDCAPTVGVDPERAWGMVRTATKYFREALKETLAKDSNRLGSIEESVRHLLEVLHGE